MLKKLGLRPEDHEPQMVTDDEVQLNQEMGQQDPINSQWFTQGAPTSSQQFDEQVPSSSQFSQQGPTGSQLFPHFTSSMLMQMMEQASMSSIPSQHPGPIPDSVFISSNRPMARPAPLTTATKKGKAATKKRKPTKKSADSPPHKRKAAKKAAGAPKKA
ncbi:unnamed protein product [Urochloa humidicola]